MQSLFDSDVSSPCSEAKSTESIFTNDEYDDDDDDDATTFTVATVFENRGRKRDKSRRDTITRTMPTISIHDDDRYAIPTTVQKKQMGHQTREERMQLRVSSSLMDDSFDSENGKERMQLRLNTSLMDDSYSDSDNDAKKEMGQQNHKDRLQLRGNTSLMDDSYSDSDNDTDGMMLGRGKCSDMHSSGINTESSCKDGIFRTPPRQDGQIEVSSTKSTAVRRNASSAAATPKQANLLDVEVGIEAGIDPEQTKYINRIHSSETFMSVYEDLAAKNRASSISAQPKHHGRGAQVKDLVVTAFKTVKDGLSISNSCDGGSWDVEDIQHNVTGKKRAIAIEERSDNGYGRQRNRRKSLNIRAELALMQDLVHEKAEECDSLKLKLQESQSHIQLLQNENAVVVQSNVLLESKLKLSREAREVAERNSTFARAEADASSARAESLSVELKSSQSEVKGLRRDLRDKNIAIDTVKERLQQAESEFNRWKGEKKNVQRYQESLKSRAELQNEVDRMRNALKEIRDLENIRSKKNHRTEVELQVARDALAKVNSAAVDVESILASMRSAMKDLQNENGSLRAQLKQQNNIATSRKQWKMEWEEQEEGIEVAEVMGRQMNELTTPNTASLSQIISLGAEVVENTSKPALKGVLQETPDSSSRQLSFTSDNSLFPAGKENDPTMKVQQSECSLCFRPPRPNGFTKSCQCGRDDCNKWAHASCILNRKSVSSCVSHPGTPAPQLPIILCGGIWDNKCLG